MNSSQQASPILELHGISKQFPGVRALSDAGLRLYPGEVHALMGQNGAGKSTLIKVMNGVIAPDTGRILLEGKAIHPSSTLEAQSLGISTVYQEVNLCPNLSVAENIFIGRYPRRFGSIAWRTMRREAQKLLERLKLDIDVTAPLSSFPLAIQQMVALARALNISARVLILD
ncbi:MAG: sugar ABC transporter ATP-binding protein, partial [Burkholderiaceae bacterium]|nr:sugar ABC transporter ATP-binding protein [Burkholderiaceae bacterium]